uniref:Cytochrome c oxidase subunit 3 n=1 Tax=Dolichoris vasculosae TaxID=130022 RepID=A0A8A2F8R6_9HYME|nr:cytochrome c oxidase subunit III [Dolichoris vasculosae]
MKDNYSYSPTFQPYHMVKESPWPLLMSIGMSMEFYGIYLFFKHSNWTYMWIGMTLIVYVAIMWWYDMVQESIYYKDHTSFANEGFKIGVITFIISESMFFFSFFWCLFDTILITKFDFDFPIPGIGMFDPNGFPLLNTILLVTSSFTAHYSHMSIKNNNKFHGVLFMFYTVMLGIIFSYFQYLEYYESEFTIADSIYGSIFFMLTGFHGLHVMMGTTFFVVTLFRMLINHFNDVNHLSIELGIWYWHFVDMVWILLYLMLYKFPYLMI